MSGTATEATLWLLIEVPAAWGGRALAESDLPADVKSCLLAWEAGAASRRVQFIRRETGAFDTAGRIAVFAAYVPSRSSGASRPPALYALHLDAYGDILDIDLDRLNSRKRPVHGFRHTGPIFLTCTNGRRDACCAKWGREMAVAVADAAGHQAWQTTHLGGHRFAPTLLVLPHGSQYGWLTPDDAEPLVDAHRKGRLYRADCYRGHVGFPRPVQVAAAHLREQIGTCKLDALTLVDITTEGEGTTPEHETPESKAAGKTSQVRFRVGASTYEVEIHHEEGEAIPLSCRADPKPTERLMPVSCQSV